MCISEFVLLLHVDLTNFPKAKYIYGLFTKRAMRAISSSDIFNHSLISQENKLSSVKLSPTVVK